jgi:hypothetical protein
MVKHNLNHSPFHGACNLNTQFHITFVGMFTVNTVHTIYICENEFFIFNNQQVCKEEIVLVTS